MYKTVDRTDSVDRTSGSVGRMSGESSRNNEAELRSPEKRII